MTVDSQGKERFVKLQNLTSVIIRIHATMTTYILAMKDLHATIDLVVPAPVRITAHP